MLSLTYGTFPALLPGATTTMSRNGLQRTSGTILCKPGEEADAISLAESYGTVFPDISTRRTDMGLFEISFDAYEAVGSSTGRLGTMIVALSKTFSGTYPLGSQILNTTWTINEFWLVDTYTKFMTTLSGLSLSAIDLSPPGLSHSLQKRWTVGRSGYGGPTALPLSWSTVVSDVTRRNFGDIDEVDVTFSPVAAIT